MRSAYRISPRLVAALVIAGAILIGWVARTTRGQQGTQASSPAPSSEAARPAPETPLTLPAPPSEGGAPAIADSPGPKSESSKHEFLPPTETSVPPQSGPPDPAGPTNDDPEKSARAFLEQNRRVAQGELRKLKDEADQLRTRLGKVEAGIRRWEALVAALDHSEKPATPRPAMPPGADHPTDLSPVDAPMRAMAVRESSPIGASDDAPTVVKAGTGEPGEPTKPPHPTRTPSSDKVPPLPAGTDSDINRPRSTGPALEPR